MALEAVQNVSKIGEDARRTLAEHAELANRSNTFLQQWQPAALIKKKKTEVSYIPHFPNRPSNE